MAKVPAIEVPVNVTLTSGNAGTVTIHEAPEAIVLPKFGSWPQFWAPRWARNGREAGTWLAACVTMIPEKCAHVVLKEDHVAGAIHAMVEGGLQVKAFSGGEDGDQTFEVRSIHHEFVEPPR